MRFPVAAIFLVILEFIAFIIYAVLSYLLELIEDVFTPLANLLTPTSKVAFLGELNNLTITYGIVSVIIFILIIIAFVVDALRDEPEDDLMRVI